MSRSELIDKIEQLLTGHNPVSEECHVVYLMVEIRKIIDQEHSKATYPVLKFYADWAVHSKKDVVTAEMKQVTKDMYDSAVAQINAPYGLLPEGSANPIRDFAYMEQLKSEMATFLTAQGITDVLTVNKTTWVAFVGLMVKVLENQPIVKPVPEVSELRFEPANVGCVIAIMMFAEPVNGNAYYRYGNAY